MAHVPILPVLLADRDHADVRSVWFNGDMYSNDRAQGVQMPRHSRLTRGYDRRATVWTQVCQAPRYQRRRRSEALSHWERASCVCGP